jgi:lysozyme family protein
MQTNFLPITDFTQKAEGLYQRLRSDPGNWTQGGVGHGSLVGTMRGISAPTMVRWMGGNPANVTVKVMQSIDEPTFRAIASAFYWRPLNCDALPAGIDAMVFDFGFNAGIRTAARLLQIALCVPDVAADGDIGPRTIAAVMDVTNGGNIQSLIDRLETLQVDYYRGLRLFASCGDGWIARTTQRRDLAHKLARQSPAEAAA